MNGVCGAISAGGGYYTTCRLPPGHPRSHLDNPWQPVTTPQPAKEPTMCEAQEALTRIAFEIELQWGSGRLDLPKIQALTKTACTTHKELDNA